MPELPDIVVYVEALRARLIGKSLTTLDVRGIAVLKTYDPPTAALHGKKVVGVQRLGKRVVFTFEGDLFLVIHLMVGGRFKWIAVDAKIPAKVGLAALRFGDCALLLTEAATKRRASIWVYNGETAMLGDHQRSGIEPLEITRDAFTTQVTARNRTLKRALTDPQIFSGIGNAFSDEILLEARLSPVRRSQQLDTPELTRLYEATVSTLTLWLDRLRDEAAENDGWPKKVTAFRPDMVVHGKFRQPCSVCGTEVQRIRYASNEVNYCPTCQTDGKILADRSLSRLLKDDWPKTIEDLEDFRPETNG